MELEGTLLLERSPTRRWISIVAVVIPVAAIVMIATWFIRAYIAPPTIAIPNQMMLAATPSPPAAPARSEAPRVERPPTPPAAVLPRVDTRPIEPPASQAAPPRPSSAAVVPAVPPLAATAPEPPTASVPPMIAALAVAPPRFSSFPSSPPAVSTEMAAQTPAPESSALEDSEPLKGPVPLPRHRPHVSASLSASAVPLPRPRPALDDTTPPDLPSVDRHAVD